ncbi:isoaspartyl peptidase/L-asparaginase [Halpernia sp. GG3]
MINIENVKNPIPIAQDRMKTEDRVLGDIGAKKYATKNGFKDYSTEIPQRRKEYLEKSKSSQKGTVGCVVLDKNGKIAAATSTGGEKDLRFREEFQILQPLREILPMNFAA